MQNKISRIQIYLILLAFLTAVALYYGGYHLYVVPIKNEASQLKHQLVNYEKAIAETGKETEGSDALSSSSAQRFLPVVHATDQLLLNLQEAEIQSGSNIQALSLVQADDEMTEGTNQPVPIPEEIKAINYHVEATAGNYSQLYVFLSELQQMDRLIDFKLIKFGRETENRLQFTVTFQAFYDPSLPALAGEMPEETFLPPAGKKSPFREK